MAGRLRVKNEDETVLYLTGLAEQEIVLKLTGHGQSRPTVDLEHRGDFAILRWTYGAREGAVNKAELQVQHAGTIE